MGGWVGGWRYLPYLVFDGGGFDGAPDVCLVGRELVVRVHPHQNKGAWVGRWWVGGWVGERGGGEGGMLSPTGGVGAFADGG